MRSSPHFCFTVSLVASGDWNSEHPHKQTAPTETVAARLEMLEGGRMHRRAGPSRARTYQGRISTWIREPKMPAASLRGSCAPS